jgi:MFS family permease
MSSELSERRAALIAVTLTSFLTPFMVSSVNIALPAIGNEFSLDAVMMGWVPTSYLLAAAIFLLPFGRFADLYGRKRIFAIGISVYTVSALVLAFVPSVFPLIALSAAQGIGATMMFGTGMAILTAVYPAGERGKVLGIVTAAVYVGLSTGPFVGGLLTHYFGWRSIFLVNLPLGLIALGFALWNLKADNPERAGVRYDFGGATIYGLSLGAMMLGFARLPGIVGAVLLPAGMISLVFFYRWELGRSRALLPVHILRGNAAFLFSNLAALINYSATFSVGFLLSLYLQYIQGLTPEKAGTILVAQPIVMAAFSPLAGRLSDRIEPRVVASIGMALVSLGLVSFAFVNHETSMISLVAGLMILGLGFALFASPNTNAVMSSIDRQHYGVASAVLGTMRLTGQMFSMALATLIFTVVIGRVKILPDVYPQFLHSVHIAFVIMATLCAVGVFVSLKRGRVR